MRERIMGVMMDTAVIMLNVSAPIAVVFMVGVMMGSFDMSPAPADEVQQLREDLAHAQHKRDLAYDLIEQTYQVDHISDLDFWSMQVTVSAYTARAEECDSTPEVAADMTPSRQGILAVSPDMLVGRGLKMGDTVLLVDGEETLGVFQIHDKMNARWRKRVDILHGNLEAARLFGVRENVTLVKVVDNGGGNGE